MYYKNCLNKTNRIGKAFDLAFLFQRTINKNKTNAVLFLFMLFASNLSFSQLALQEFQTGIPASWAVQSNQTVTNNWQATTTGGYQGTAGVSVNPALNNTSGTTAQYFLITEQFNTPSNGEIKFFTKQGSFTNRGTTYQLRVSTASQPDISSFNVVLQTWTEAQLNVAATTYEEKTVSIGSLQAGIPVYLAFVAITNQTGTTATSGDTWFVDNVRVITACAPVANVVTTPTATTAQITWSHPTSNSFEIQVLASGAGIGATGTAVTGTSYAATNLTNNTTYDAYIRAVCTESTSAWVGPFTFTTTILGQSCATPIIVPSNVTTTPYILSTNLNTFHTNTNYVPINSQGLSCVPPGVPPTWNLFSGDHAFLSFTPATSGLVNFTQQIQTSGNGCFSNANTSIFIFDSCAGVATEGSCLGGFITGNPSSVTYAELTNFYVAAGQTYIILISSPYLQSSTGASICFTFTISAPTCPIPSGLSFSNLLQTSGSFSWQNPQNLVSNWEYVAIPADSGVPNGSETLTTTTTPTNNPLTNLVPNTDYNLFVRSVCNGVPGPWSSALPFTTQCSVQTVPYYSGFNNDLEISCWSQLNLNNDPHKFNFGNSANSEPVARLRTSGLSLITNDMLITPQFTFDGVTQKQIRFKYQAYGSFNGTTITGESSYAVKLSTTGVGEANFTTELAPLETFFTGFNWVERVVVVPQNVIGNVNIAWHLPLGSVNTATQFYIEDVYIEDLPACSPPSYATIVPGSITNTSATFSWTNGYNNTQWEVIAVPYGSGTPVTGGLLVNTNPYTLTGLIHSTKYEFYVRAYCSETEQSAWAPAIVFNTLCDAQELPYFETFNEDDLDSKRFCWSTNNVANDAARWRFEATEVRIQPQANNMFTPFTNFDDWLISAPINVVGLKVLKFDYRAATTIFVPNARGNFEVMMSSTPDFATYTVLKPSEDFFNSNYVTDEIIFTGTGITYFAFRVPPTIDNPSNFGIVMIDNFTIEDLVACPAPSVLSATAITTTTATLNWVVGYQETQWEVAVQEELSGIPTSGVIVNTNPIYTANNLTEDTKYEYYVRAVCASPDVSVWVGPFKFKTLCNVLPTPFLETFDSNSETESCWTVVNNNGNDNFWQLNQPVNPIAGDQMAAIFSGTNGDNDDWLITPTLNIQPNQRLRFSYKVYDSFFEEDLKIKLSTSGTALSAFNTILYETSFSTTTAASGTTEGSNTLEVASSLGVKIGDVFYITNFPFAFGTTVTAINGNVLTMSTNATLTQPGVQPVTFTHETINNTVVKEKIINLTDITIPTNTNIAFQIPFFPPNPWAYRGQYLFIDNVIVENIPACSSVINVVTSNITDTSVTVAWETVGTETSWEISVQPFGTPAPNGATNPAYLHTSTTNPKTITGLQTATKYQYYVRAICEANNESEWVGPFEFTTKCDFSNVCQYTITVTNGSTGRVTRHVNLMQNGFVFQQINFPSFGQTSLDYTVFLCNGVQFDLYWNGGGGSGTQYSQAQLIIKDANDVVVWTSPLGLGTVNTNIYSGIATCGTITCPQPTNLTANNLGELSWTAGGTETQWEVFVQPLNNGTLPQSGTIVNSPNYTPVASDFVDTSASTYEYFVRAICSSTNKSYWSGPKAFIRNDDASNSITLPVNIDHNCSQQGTDVSFLGATPSTEPSSCEGINGGDVWFDFVATSKVHTIELSNFNPGSYYNSAFVGIWPKIIMSLYEVQTDGSLVEKICSENNSITAHYASELTIGKTYKIRLKLDSAIPNDKKFNICVTTPLDVCEMDAFNYGFEKLTMQSVTGVTTILNARVIPGWRVNTDSGSIFFQEANNSPGIYPYQGAQCIQLVHDNASTWDTTSPIIKGIYKDYDTSEIPLMDYSFASATRSNGATLQLYAGPPSGPFTLVTEHYTNTLVWSLITGSYNVPSGQTTTRFIFRVKNYEFGHLLDAANFKANTDIITPDTTLPCNENSINVVANGVGQWIADANNPATTTIAAPNSGSTQISGFTTGGNYVYHWKTRYCEKTITVNYQTETQVPTVENLTYCLNAVTTPLTATAPAGYSLLWFTSATGTGSATAPTPSTATAGTTTYYVALVNALGCEGPKESLTVTVKDLPIATISGATTICSGNSTTIQFSGTPNAQISYTINGTPSTIALDANGVASVPTGNLGVTTTYTLVSVASNETPACTQNYTGIEVIVTVNPTVTPVTSFEYGTSICANETIVLPTLATDFTSGGSFTSSSGLVINPTTGALNVASSAKGTYMITYTVTANPTACLLGGTSQFEITLNPEITAEITADCVNDALILMVNPLNNSFSTNAVTYSWKDSSNQTLQTNSTFNVDTYLGQNPLVTFPFTITVEINSNNCLGTTSFTVQNDPCKFIPRGISPNNDGDNDTFDLSGIGVRELIIFNRYGMSVYSFSGNYTNQWRGQTDKGENLPTGTYFYNIVKNNGQTITGWVYINN
jgi:gliding motility-associated-like protein